MIAFLIEWAVRSSILILGGTILLCALRTKDASIKLAAWTAMLGGSLAIPFLGAVLPKITLAAPQLTREVPRQMENSIWITALPHVRRVRAVQPVAPVSRSAENPPAKIKAPASDGRIDLVRWVAMVYVPICGVLLLRVLVGLAIGLRLRGDSRSTGELGIRTWDRIEAPVTLGFLRPVIVLPADWREWDRAKLDAVLAHERAHVRRFDPLVQLVSVIHRALLWPSPMAWLLHQKIVRTAEEASDDAAIAAVGDRTWYAEILIEFMRRGVWGSTLAGTPMARNGAPVERINRILEEKALSRGVTPRSLAAIALLGLPLAWVAIAAQGRPEFEIADVHRSASATNPDTFASGGQLHAGRYDLRRATMLDLIRIAWGVDADEVVGGPSWLEFDRFDISAEAAPATPPAAVDLMLQNLLADRFDLALHKDTRPRPVFVLTLGSGKPKLKAANGSGDTGCHYQRPSSAATDSTVSCRNMTLSEFARALRGMASDYLANNAVVDSTDLEGRWDFDLRWNRRARIPQTGSERVTIFEAIDKQLGLTLKLQQLPTSVIVVDHVNETPTANPPGVARMLPPRSQEFEVAAVKLSAPGEQFGYKRYPGGRIEIHAFPMKMLIATAWDVDWDHMDERITGAPKWIDSKRFDIIAKTSAASEEPRGTGFMNEDLQLMLRRLLVARFRISTHYEDRLVPAYALTATRPKLTKADPSHRATCREAPFGANDPREINPTLSRLIQCQNMTMAQFAQELQSLDRVEATYNEVVDETGLKGSYDFSINFSPRSLVQSSGEGAPGLHPADSVVEASEPDGAISFRDALSRQLGLKLEMRKRPMPVLVIDHIEEKPTGN